LLVVFWSIMRPAIDLDDELWVTAKEVRVVWAERDLPSKMQIMRP